MVGSDNRGREAGDWLDITDQALPIAEAVAWATVPGCGGVVTFTGTVRDHAEGRPGVTVLEYEAYEGPALGRLEEVAAAARRQWPGIGRLVVLHRIGRLTVCDAAVVVVVSAPHRDEAFDAARWCIDTVKASVPIWKKEEWAGGSDWGTGAQPITSAEATSATPPNTTPPTTVPATSALGTDTADARLRSA